MKTTKLILMAFAVAGMLVSCSKAADNGIDSNENALKTVTVTIANPATRAALNAADSTKNGDAVAAAADLQIYFLNGSTIVESYALTAADIISGSTYTFHSLPSTVGSAVITNKSNTGTVAEMKARTTDIAALNDSLKKGVPMLVWGEGTFGTTPVSEDLHDGVVTYRYACAITVAPLVAKVEIVNVAPLATAGSKFATFVPDTIGIHNIAGIADVTPEPIEVGGVQETAEQTALRGLGLWNATKAAAGWNVDAYAADKVFAYVVPADVPAPDIVLQGTGTASIGLANPYYVRSNGFSNFTGNLVAGNVYRVNFTYAHDDIKPWYVGDLKCVDVAVTIKTWTTVALAPIFQ